MDATPTTASRNTILPRAVLWDLDGTLADSREAHWRSWCEALEAHDIRITQDAFSSTFGQRNDAILRQWIGPDIAADLIRTIGDAKEESYRAIIKAEGLIPLPGAAEWVRRLHAEGWRQAIASSAPRLNVQVMREALDLVEFIESFVGAEDVKRGKPDPEVFLAAAVAVGVPAERCVVVEDAKPGVQAARRAGMRCIGVGDGLVEEADVVVRSLADLPGLTFDKLIEAG